MYNNCFATVRRKVPYISRTSLLILKTIVAVMMLGFQLQASTLAQSVTANFKNAHLKDVFEQLRKQTGVGFLYKEEDLKDSRRVNASFENKPLEGVLQSCFAGQPLVYEAQNNFVVVKRKPIAVPMVQNVQEINIHGMVTDQQGLPLQGVSIHVKGAGIATNTDNQGMYKLNVPNRANILVFSYIGYDRQEVTVGERTEINIVLKEEERNLDEVVVIGYGTVKRSENTGSIASVKGEDIAQKPTLSFEGALGGQAAGVNMTANAGIVNQAPVFRIRGTNSLSLSSYPLIVVDGIPMYTEDVEVGGNASNNPLAAINPADIESIDIAKDAAATSIYGSRAANGVVFVTTKSGKRGKAKVNYDAYFGMNKAVRLAEVLNAEQYLEIKNEGLVNAGTYDPVTNYYDYSLDANGNRIDTRWYDYIFRTGTVNNHSINISGASEATRYFFSAGLTEQGGIVQKNDFDRKNISYNLDHQVNDWLKVGSKMNYTTNKTRAVMSLGTGVNSVASNSNSYRLGFISAPIVAPFNNDGTYNVVGPNIGIMDNEGHLTATPRMGYTNPVLSLSENDDYTGNHFLQGNVSLDINPLPWITFRTVYAINNMESKTYRYFSPLTNEGQSRNGRATAVNASRQMSTWTNTLTLNPTLAEGHTINVLLGHEEQRTERDGFGLIRDNQSDDFYRNVQGGFSELSLTNTNDNIAENFLVSLFSRAQYSLQEKYFLSGNLRYDQSSVLGRNNKSGTFWGIGAGWDVFKEDFYANSSFAQIIQNLKLKASYGKVGNLTGIGDYASLTTYAASLYGVAPGLYYSTAGNEDLRWETSKKMDLGLSFTAANKFNFDIAYYDNRIDGLIFGVPTPSSAGIPSQITANRNQILANVGEMYNRGVEFTFTTTPIRNENFTWNLSLNVSNNTNKVLSLADGINSLITDAIGGSAGMTSITEVGGPIGVIYAIRTDGVDSQTGRRIFLDGEDRQVFFQQIAPPGGYQWEYADGSMAPAVNVATDAVAYKATQPKFFGGFSNRFSYKGFDLDMLWRFQIGGYNYWGTQSQHMDHRFQNNIVKVLDRWQNPGDITDVPRLQDGDITSWGYSVPITANVFKSDFLRLQNIALGYTLPTGFTQKAQIDRIRVYGSIQNALLFTPYPGADPEVTSAGNATTSQGFDKNVAPNARTFTFGLQVSF
ncbi:TonB-dependent receptor [Sphingobacterium phlebotomi]|uniref:TonB-dependent receptor n=1 Tax=Sphingobacterium phlebotomi TaxID=2605433 RepID=A0A5D4HCS8_9SPHI|nr:TonB-dependent receptor [Sphingobacterium phlebotomi]TYR37345.1 TonB-dependent receptor [Sphingobacterium phlebotomi]